MNFNYEQARELMVINQLRPNKINEKNILDLFINIPKENFVHENHKKICYSDNNIDILDNRGYLKNLHLAQILNHAKITDKDKVMHIGGLTGYLSYIISKLCKKIFIIEENKNLIENLNENLKNFNVENAEVFASQLEEGLISNAPYDLIIIDCPLFNLNEKLIQQLNPNEGRLIYIKKIKDNLSKAYKIIRNEDTQIDFYLFDVFSNFYFDKVKSEFKL